MAAWLNLLNLLPSYYLGELPNDCFCLSTQQCDQSDSQHKDLVF